MMSTHHTSTPVEGIQPQNPAEVVSQVISKLDPVSKGSAEPTLGCSAAELAEMGKCESQVVQIGQHHRTSLYKVPNAIIVGEYDPFVFATNSTSPTAIWESHFIRPHFDWNLQSNLESKAWLSSAVTIKLDNPVLFLAGTGAHNFYHWMHDCLPRLLVALNAGVDLPVVVPAHVEGKNNFIRESLSLLGITGEDKVIEHHGGRIEAPEVFLVEDLFQHKSAQVHHTLLNELRSRLLAAVGADCRVDSSSLENRVFISREGNNTTRTPLDAVTLNTALESEGFRKVRMEHESLASQIRIMATATEVVAPHGAGLFNTLFMSRGHVIEMFPLHPEHHIDPNKKLVEPCWFRILAAHQEHGREITWDQFNCRVKMLSNTDFSQYNIIVDPKDLLERLR